jgi:hypothetical protein
MVLGLDVSRLLLDVSVDTSSTPKVYISNVTAPASGGRERENHQNFRRLKLDLSEFELPGPKGSFHW